MALIAALPKDTEPRPPMRVAFDLGDRAALLHGQAIDLPLGENTVDALVCDPPSGIGFMGKTWDGDRGGWLSWSLWLAEQLAPAFRALKPGAHGFVWALPRTSWWTALALHLCGFEIRDRASHIFLNGMPKSLTSESADIPKTAGTALKPAVEDWHMVRKPLDGTVAGNLAEYGTGTLNIGACRIGDSGGGTHCTNRDEHGKCRGHDNAGRSTSGETVHGPESSGGKWPAHLLVDDDVTIDGVDEPARYFYAPKPARSEKDSGLDHLPVVGGHEVTGRDPDSAGAKHARSGKTGASRNFHPTVKSVALMRWLIRLITPPGGTVLDPFTGSGTTAVAALAEGAKFVGVEMTDEYLPIIEGRVRHALKETPCSIT